MDDYGTVELPDGRTLAYGECGRTDGRPVVCLHGVLGSRLLWALLDEVAQRRDVHIVAPDRPGFGHSEFQAGRSLTDWPADVRALADALDLEEFGVVGFSGGGPHAAACAHEFGERLRGVVLVSSVAPPGVHEYEGPFERSVMAASQFVPGFSRGMFGTASWLASHWRSRFEASLVETAAAPDRELFAEPEGDLLVEDAAEAFRQGGRGPAHELPMLGRDWRFDPAEIDGPVSMYHGSADATVGVDTGRAFADLLPEADLTVVDEAHYSTLVRSRESILRAAVGER